MDVIKPKRTIDTFPAKDIELPPHIYQPDSIGEYSLRGGYGLELRRRRYKRKKPFVV